jgi:hypothetical protein
LFVSLNFLFNGTLSWCCGGITKDGVRRLKGKNRGWQERTGASARSMSREWCESDESTPAVAEYCSGVVSQNRDKRLTISQKVTNRRKEDEQRRSRALSRELLSLLYITCFQG